MSAWAKLTQYPVCKRNLKQKNWGHGSSGRVFPSKWEALCSVLQKIKIKLKKEPLNTEFTSNEDHKMCSKRSEDPACLGEFNYGYK
jgi:hypothetical protein